ncbi:hypothetical protein MSPP1_000355 [Malassezia sp. CBS 17886]|nr:hypothetical protein MSPP1_000355 [Malassezia sp. CBS 17886]
MPLDTRHFLAGQGWGGLGTPLDGEKGRGLKKPLIIPPKRNLRGIGQDRDRAVEWWDDLFAAGAKALATGGSKKVPQVDAASFGARRSLSTLAKQEHAKRMLMNGFVRGETLGDPSLLRDADAGAGVASKTRGVKGRDPE